MGSVEFVFDFTMLQFLQFYKYKSTYMQILGNKEFPFLILQFGICRKNILSDCWLFCTEDNIFCMHSIVGSYNP